MTAKLSVLLVNWAAHGGGAERAAYSLRQGLGDRGHDAWLAVANRNIDESSILEIREPDGVGRHIVSAATDAAAALGPHLGLAERAHRRLATVKSPGQLADQYLGREHFGFRSTSALPELTPSEPDIVHCHNLHGDYFNIRELRGLNRKRPVLITLHDEWLFTGHCAATLGCDRWRTGCGSCPNLSVYPALRRDSTARNLSVKKQAFAGARLFVSGPSRWIVDRARGSVLASGVADWRVIPNAVDRKVFRPTNQVEARQKLGLPQSAAILLFVANFARSSPFKDYSTVAMAARLAAQSLAPRHVLLLVVGEDGPTESFDGGEIRFVPYDEDPRAVAMYYQSADLYLHGSKTETAGLTILEAMASGTPVVATAVGGVPEGVVSLSGASGAWEGPSSNRNEATGVLVRPADAEGMAAASLLLLGDETLRTALGQNAVSRIASTFDEERQIDSTIEWYRDALDRHRQYRFGGSVNLPLG